MSLRVAAATAVLIATRVSFVCAQAPSPPPAPDAAITKRLDELNTKIDALSQEILKIEQQLAKQGPGVMIGQTETPAPVAAATAASSSSAAAASSASPAPGGTGHTVMRGETLTAIAKQYRVTVEELQKFNHIEDGRKLQAGQTIQVPPTTGAAPSSSPSPTPE